MRERGIGLPLLIRFAEILKARVVELNEAFQNAIREYGYKAPPRRLSDQGQPGAFVVEHLVIGEPFHFGLEAGSKPELLAVRRCSRTRTR